MPDTDTSHVQPVHEIRELQRQIAELKASEAELQRAKEGLKAGEEKYRTVFEHTGTAMMVVEEDTTISMANHKLEAVLGYPQEEAGKGRKWIEFVEKEELDRIIEYHIKRRENPASVPDEYELRLKHKSGEMRNYLMNVSMIPGTKKSLISLIDITDSKTALEKLQQSEHRFRETAELLPGVICEMDFNMYFTYVNKKGLEIFGYRQEELDTGIKALSVIHPDDRDRAIQGFTNVLSGDSVIPREYRMLKRDGSEITVLLNTSPMKTADKICGVRCCIIDITQHKKDREKLRQSEERFRSIFSQAPVGIALFLSTGHIIEKNRCFDEILCLAGGGDLKKTGFTLFDYLKVSRDELKNLDKGENIYRETILHPPASDKKNPHTRYLSWHVTPLGDKTMDPSLYLTHLLDVTDRKLAEEAELQKAREATEKAHRLVEDLKKEIMHEAKFHTMISRSPKMNEIFALLSQMAHVQASVLITGESGTGKELIARSLHELGHRKTKPFVAINCGALPENLLEAELFGYKAGAFTDAKKDKPGKFASAEKGTIFLDEIGDISPAMQVKLLRVLQERTYEPLGSVIPIKADVRFIAATNKDMAAMVKKGEFRKDLFYRINVLSLELPPLRERVCDIPLLCDHFIDKFNARYSRTIKGLSDDALDALLVYDFPGNIRELENIIEHAFILCKETFIQIDHLSKKIRPETPGEGVIKKITALNNLRDVERLYIESMLVETNGDKCKAAKRMGIHRATLYRKIKQLDVTFQEDGVIQGEN